MFLAKEFTIVVVQSMYREDNYTSEITIKINQKSSCCNVGLENLDEIVEGTEVVRATTCAAGLTLTLC